MFAIRVGDSAYLSANVAVAGPGYRTQPAYLSMFGYTAATEHFMSIFKYKGKQTYCPNGCGYGTTSGAGSYDIYQYKHPNTDFVHTILCSKDMVTVKDGVEKLSIMVFADEEAPGSAAVYADAPKFFDALFDKLYKNTAVPMIKDWVPYIYSRLEQGRFCTHLRVHSDPPDMKFSATVLDFTVQDLTSIIKTGLENKDIEIIAGGKTSDVMKEMTGLDAYLNTFAEKLSEKIQTSFRPLYVADEDKYSERTEFYAEYSSIKGIDLYEAQKTTIEAVSRCLNLRGSAIIVGEMGVGKEAATR